MSADPQEPIAGPECQPREPESPRSRSTGGFVPGPGPETSRRALCSIRPPFWWYGGGGCAPRPGGDPDDYEPRPRRAVRYPEDIPSVLQRLAVDSEGQYLPGQQLSAGDPEEAAPVPLEDARPDADGLYERRERDHELCSCRRETWVRGGPLGPNRPDPSEGCRCACCRPRRAPPPCPSKRVASSPATPVETWQARPPFWWWCHDKRSRLPAGDPALYAPILPIKQPQPGPPIAHLLEVDRPDFYIPGQIIFGFTPPINQYWLKVPEQCPDENITPSGLEPGLELVDRPTTSCSRHGGLPLHQHALPSLLYTEVAGARTSPPHRTLRIPKPSVLSADLCDTCCKRSTQTMAGVLPNGWRGWPGVKQAHMFYRDLDPCLRLAHCTRCKC